MANPVTFDVDGNSVEKSKATAAWAAAARPALVAVAGKYNATITYKQLGEQVQAASGISTRTLLQNWMKPVLLEVSTGNSDAEEPLLAALCVRADDTVAPTYADAFVTRYGTEAPEDLQWQAAEERLNCYRHFGANMPADGGRPTLTDKVALERRKARAKNEPKRPVCPTCNLELPRSGECGNCTDT